MSSKMEKDKTKQLQDKCQSVLNDLLRDEDNKYCVDCDSKGPRWASWNIGVFLCIRCAGIHRNLGVHISKVKSVNLDSWTPEQVVSLQQMGNSRARAVYEANLPDNFRRPQNDSSLESFIRAKYEHKKYIAREWVPPQLPKVNWEKEIEEELEKQKRKKKTTMDSSKKSSVNNVEVPQIPKPKNPSPKPNRNGTPEIKKKETKESDLLGLQNGEDSFSGFLSASSEKKPADPDPVKSEEESFFNQTIPTEKEKVKLTKDSILALYASGPPQNVPTNQFQMGYQPQQPNFPANYNVFPQQSQFPNPQQFSSQCWPQQQQQPQPQAQQWPKGAQFQAQFPPQQQFQQQNGGVMPNYTGNMQFAQQMPPQQQQPQFNQTPNPFYGNQGNLQQQFGNLTLNNGTNGSSLATNIWQ